MVDKIVNYMSKHKWKLNEMFNFQDFKSHWDVNIEKKKKTASILGFSEAIYESYSPVLE